MDEREQRAKEKAVQRRRTSPAHAKRVKMNLLTQNDLFTTCRFCGTEVVGTLESINTHVKECEKTHGHGTR